MRGAGRRSGEAVWRWLPVVAWVVVISTFSTGWFTGERTGLLLLPLLRWLFPSATLAQLVAAHHVVRKLAHFVEYLVLGMLLHRALDGARASIRQTALRALAFAAFCAAGDELHQAFVGGRTAAIWDVLLDTTGAAAGIGILTARARALTRRVPARS